jgi:tyrosinase
MWGYPYNFFENPPYKNITLDFVLAFPDLTGNVTIRDVMDVKGGALCYDYA